MNILFSFFVLLSFLFSSQFAFGALPHAYVTDEKGDTLAVIDVSNDTVQKIYGITGCRVVKVSPDGTQAYVGCDNNTLRVIDTLNNLVLPIEINVVKPVALAVSPDSEFVYVASTDDTVSVIRTGTYETEAVISGFDFVQDIKIHPDGSKAYVTNKNGGCVSVIDTQTRAIVQTITGFQSPIGLALNIDGTKGYVTDTSHHALYVFDTTTNSVTDVVLGFNDPAYIAVTPDKNRAYISNKGNDTVTILRLSDNFIIRTFPLPGPQSIAISKDGLYLYIGSSAGLVFKVYTLDNSIQYAFKGFSNPSNIALTVNNTPTSTVNACQSGEGTGILNTLTWTASPGFPHSYRVYRDNLVNGLLGSVPGTTQEFFDTNLVPGQTYQYYVIADYDNGYSSTVGDVLIAPERTCIAP